ncbi:MAG TPA: DUF2958 domain-containing protein [Thermoanaerobaculia bacterium]|nr:DUF2958 domain-containing protein [Thermoanaerobaculia bacterium]
MDLLPAELRSAIKSTYPLGAQEGLGERAKVLVKFFFPAGRYTFYVTEGTSTFAAEDAPPGDDFLFFGYALSPFGSDCDEWGYTTLSELSSVHHLGLSIERDLHLPFASRTVSELLASLSLSA